MKWIGVFVLVVGCWSSAVQAASFRSVALDKSSITFTYRQMGVSMDGKFKRFTSQVQLDSTKPAQAKGSVEIDLSSIDTGSSEADQEVVGKAWFHVAAHPKALFTLRQLKPSGPQQFEASGSLSIKGQTRDVTAPVTLTSQGLLVGTFVLKRADFGIGEGMWAKFDVVGNEITVKFTLSLQ